MVAAYARIEIVPESSFDSKWYPTPPVFKVITSIFYVPCRTIIIGQQDTLCYLYLAAHTMRPNDAIS